MSQSVHRKQWAPKAALKLVIEGFMNGYVTKEELLVIDQSLENMNVSDLRNLCALIERIRKEDSNG